MKEELNNERKPWVLYCKTCGWIVFGIAWETVIINFTNALEKLNAEKNLITGKSGKHFGHDVNIRAPGSTKEA